MNVICYCCDFSCAVEFYHLFSSVTKIVYFAQPAKCEANLHYSGKRSQSSKKSIHKVRDTVHLLRAHKRGDICRLSFLLRPSRSHARQPDSHVRRGAEVGSLASRAYFGFFTNKRGRPGSLGQPLFMASIWLLHSMHSKI